MAPKLAILAALSLTALAFATVPTAHADTCAAADPTVEEVVCGAYDVAGCVTWAAASPKQAAQRLATCDPAL